MKLSYIACYRTAPSCAPRRWCARNTLHTIYSALYNRLRNILRAIAPRQAARRGDGARGIRHIVHYVIYYIVCAVSGVLSAPLPLLAQEDP
eukprot:6493882-Pyramimonas_sp.AAC.1